MNRSASSSRRLLKTTLISFRHIKLGPHSKPVTYVLVLLLLAVPAAVLHAKFKDPQKLNVADRAVLQITGAIQNGLFHIIDSVAAGFRHYGWLVHVRNENEVLQQENTQLKMALQAALSRMAHVNQLEALLELRQQLPMAAIGARVIGVNMNPFFRILRITLDAKPDKLREGLPVLVAHTQPALVGRIQRVYGHYADVLLVADPQSAVDVMDLRSGTRGILRGTNSSVAYAGRMEYVSRTDTVEAGDLLVTSGLGLFPPYIPVAEVKSVHPAKQGLYQNITATALVDFSRLTHVLVVTGGK